MEGGSNYWYLITDYVFPEGVSYVDFKEGGKHAEDEYWHPSQLIPFVDGCSLLIRDAEDEDGPEFVLGRAAITQGVEAMKANYPKHWDDFVNENDDADTGDVFLQCCLFGELVYG